MESKNIRGKPEQRIKEEKIFGESDTLKEKIIQLEKEQFKAPELFICIEELKILLARSLLIEACIESIEDINCFHYMIFFPIENKLLAAEKIIEELFVVNPLHIDICTLYVRIMIYKSRLLMDLNKKSEAEEILKSCMNQFKVSHSKTVRKFLSTYGLLFCELYMITGDELHRKKALEYLIHAPHLLAIFHLRCAIIKKNINMRHCFTKFMEWKQNLEMQSLYKNEMASLDRLDDETAEIILGLVSIQWKLFVQKAYFETDLCIKFDEWTKDFPENSFFMTRLKLQGEVLSFDQRRYNIEFDGNPDDEGSDDWI